MSNYSMPHVVKRKVATRGLKKKNPTQVGGLTRKEQKQSRAIAKKTISDKKERKYSDFFIYDNLASYNPPLTNKMLVKNNGIREVPDVYDSGTAFTGFQTGYYLNDASNELNTAFGAQVMYPLGGYSMPQGTTAETIDGEYGYDCTKILNLRIAMQYLDSSNEQIDATYPTSFRVLVVKAGAKQAGQTPSLEESLFVDDKNERCGIGGQQCSAKQIMHDWKVNKNQFHKIKEYNFILQNNVDPNPSSSTTDTPLTGNTTGYKNYKDLRILLPIPKKKLRFSITNVTDENAYEPVNYDFVHYILILASHSIDPNPNRVCKNWSARISGQSSFKDM